MAAGRGHQLLGLALLVVIYADITVDANKNKAVGKIEGNRREIGNHDYITWIVAPRKKVTTRLCPSSAPSKKPNLGLAWYGFDDVQNRFASFKNCSEIARNETGNWQDYTARLR